MRDRWRQPVERAVLMQLSFPGSCRSAARHPLAAHCSGTSSDLHAGTLRPVKRRGADARPRARTPRGCVAAACGRGGWVAGAGARLAEGVGSGDASWWAAVRAERCAPLDGTACGMRHAPRARGRRAGSRAGAPVAATGSLPARGSPGQGVLGERRQREALRGPWSQLDIAHILNGPPRYLCARAAGSERNEQGRSLRSSRQGWEVH